MSKMKLKNGKRERRRVMEVGNSLTVGKKRKSDEGRTRGRGSGRRVNSEGVMIN